MTKATIYNTGKVLWEPPAIFMSACEIDVEYFPFDEQKCILKFGAWSYTGTEIAMNHWDLKEGMKDTDIIKEGIDLKDFYQSAEWDIIEIPAQKNVVFYPCCSDPFIDIQFKITIRRKTLFYTTNLIVPCVAISCLTVLVFYLPSDSGEKMTLCISVLLALTVFFLLLVEIIPPSSLVIPLIGKYLLFTMVLVTLSIIITVVVLNIHFRSPATHKMSNWVRIVFLQFLPKILRMYRPPSNLTNPDKKDKKELSRNIIEIANLTKYISLQEHANPRAFERDEPFADYDNFQSATIGGDEFDTGTYPFDIVKALEGAEHIKEHTEEEKQWIQVRNIHCFLS